MSSFSTLSLTIFGYMGHNKAEIIMIRAQATPGSGARFSTQYICVCVCVRARVQITRFLCKKIINTSSIKQTTLFMSSWNRICLLNNSNTKLRIEGRLDPTSFIDGFSINFRDRPFLKISETSFFNKVIFFIYNIKRDTRSKLIEELDLKNISILS